MNEWKNGYKEGFADGYAAAKKEMNYTNFPPLYWQNGGPVMATDPRAASSTTRADGCPSTGPFVTGMTMASSDC